ncbi:MULTISPECIES: DNA-binding protein [Apilactobacillus]|uniref:DNA-binding protein n=1 Tax=Apilactobacillus TaxID=2767877 RepID=UPI00112ADE25|nr:MULTISPECIES: DNA-binding protein [Apilactobacillus]TPR12724.1 DNA-binding protein [Apilactobacillus timberlakei]TPR38007.1 DNA-binding protein [Apilactobacillus micheneri]
MNYKQALNYFDISSYNTLYKYIENGLSVTKIGNKKFIDKIQAEKFISEHTFKIKKEV